MAVKWYNKDMDIEEKPWLFDAGYMAIVRPLLETEMVQKLDDITHHYTSTRLQHSLRVSYTSYLVCKKRGWNAEAAARAGLLHDLFFYDWRTTKFAKSHAYIHPRIALRNARKITTISPLEEDIIVKHMWGATLNPPRYKESFVVSFVDDYVAMKEGAHTARFKWKTRKHFHRKVMES